MAESQPLLSGPSSVPAGPTYTHSLYPIVNDPFSAENRLEARRRARSRFLKSLLAGLAVWAVTAVIISVLSFGERDWWDRRHQRENLPDEAPSPPRADGHAVKCNGWGDELSDSYHLPDGYYARVARFELSVKPDDLIFLKGTGAFSNGAVDFALDDDLSVDHVTVKVEAQYNDPRLLKLANVCQMTKRSSDEDYVHGRESGIGLYTPLLDSDFPGEQLWFRVHYRLSPRLASLAGLVVSAPVMRITGDLPTLLFDRVDLQSNDANIDWARLNGHSVRLLSSNGALRGDYNVSQSLSLRTTNGAIDVAVSLFPVRKLHKRLPGPPPTIESSTDLSSTVIATTTNGMIDLRYIAHPVGQELHSLVSSTNGKASVSHRPTFEGDFELSTSWGSAVLSGPDSQSDPSGDKRERVLDVRRRDTGISSSIITGSVYWSDHDAHRDRNARDRGDTKVKTSLGAASLHFQ
ncbi:uncharacterized protein L969DRAFT_52985 [Mixia osmundae IAM 14324]|uniref:Adhesin domain-containing protein n=1 Tax=Mixia osmundae (strain CBS 9802 / IAM 14324 / JCM 22182 / KY 12970) TaxID=764103 RepID=G7DWJ6_MIXOS|nr:uncharacterized protein L969DRAFT_52985 [Mixia osmundae IAM 14324]KEI37357.1 hypothetical protein L969DRAFT_52985 [Mixia osmundae IAM 14324]GAA94956.1 hypothetical protein E5Q_01611 [Mixia osmundae IAM 14324]